MATRRELIIKHYSEVYYDLKTRIGDGAELLPSLDDIDVADLVFFLSIYFAGQPEGWAAAINQLIASNKIVLTPEIHAEVIATVIAFVSWFKTLT